MEHITQLSATPSNGNAMLEAINLSKRYEDGTLALDRVSFAVQPGQIFAMLGANGAGKTTAINLFLNFIEPTEGEARVAGIATHREPLRAKSKLAFVSENVMLYSNFTAIQNLDFFAQLAGRKNCTRDDYRQVLLRAGLASHESVPPVAGAYTTRDRSINFEQLCVRLGIILLTTS